MPCKSFIGKRAIFALFSFLFLVACSQTRRQWQLTSNQGAHSNFSSSRLCLSPEDKFSGLELDILSSYQGVVAYINAFGIELQAEGESPEGYPTVTVTIAAMEKSQNFTGFLLQGGHRILLPEEARELIVNHLHNDQNIEITVAHCSTTIIPDNFAKHYKNL